MGLLAIRNKYKMLQLMQYIELAYQALEQERRELEQSGCFQEEWYRFKYMDGKTEMSPIQHYLLHGVYTGASPAPWFNSLFYLYAESDIYAACVDPFIHYQRFGRHENRFARPDLSPTMLNYQERIDALNAQARLTITRQEDLEMVAG